MSLLIRIKTGVVLSKQSISVMRQNPALLLFPIASGIASIAFFALLVTPMLGVVAVGSENLITAAGIVALLGLYLGTAFISVFFAAALVDQTFAVLNGAEPSLKAGIHNAWTVKGPLFVWAAISATVGAILDVVSESSDSIVGQIIGAVIGFAWTVLTFFVVPVIVFESPSVKEMFSRSGETFKNTYGETPVSLGVTRIIGLLSSLVLLAPGAYAFIVLESTLVGLVLLVGGVGIVQLVSSTLRGIVKTALYFYATEGQQPDEFEEVFDTLGGRLNSESGEKAPFESEGNSTTTFGGVR